MNIDWNFFTALMTKIFASQPPVFLGIFLIALGYGLKSLASVPNRFIPRINYLVAMLVFPLIAKPDPSSLPQQLPELAGLIRNVMGGIIIATVAWVAHAFILRRFIDRFMPQNGEGETKFFPKPPDSGTTPP